ncbi:hypothetical protein [Streptomyces sp. NPDC059071]|uniref:hypothetical protein n=1 Tax=unclassified Streptomyces TaxID=2593676 RepID=UPI0036277994
MTLEDGRRVRLATELRLTGSVEPVGGPADTAGVVAGFLSLAAGTEGTVERAEEHAREEGPDVREYVRLKSLHDDFGSQMPPGSRKQLEEQIGSLEPAWIAFQQARPRVTVRVRFDNGFVLDGADAALFTPC